MSWMTPAGLGVREASDGLDTAGTAFAEDVLDAMVPLLHPDQAESKFSCQVADHVVGRFVSHLHLDHPPDRPRPESRVDQRLSEQPAGIGASLDFTHATG